MPRHLFGWGSGAQGRDRTADTAIFSRMLYQLSYLGVGWSRLAGQAMGALAVALITVQPFAVERFRIDRGTGDS